MKRTIQTSSIRQPGQAFYVTVHNDSDFPFNLKFSTRPEYRTADRFSGPGSYSVFDMEADQLLYLGIYTPSDSVVHNRYRKHIQTLTLRGQEVTFKKKESPEVFLNKIRNEHLAADLRDCTSFRDRLVQDRCVSHLNKANYAADNWKMFRSLTARSFEQLDGKLHFQFDRILGPQVDKQFLKKMESQLIAQFNPLTNSSYTSERCNANHCSGNEISRFIEQCLLS